MQTRQRGAGDLTLLVGCDFTSSPNRRKPITIASGTLHDGAVRLEQLEFLESLDVFAAWLQPGRDWFGAFDLPFGLPRELLFALDWPMEWSRYMRHYAALSRPQIREQFAGFCQRRPSGAKFAHRATDRPAGSSPSMKWVNPPVAYMLHAGVPLLMNAGVHIPGLHEGGTADRNSDGHARRVAVEAYPGLLARELVGRASYKSDDRRKHTPERRAQRQAIVQRLVDGKSRLALRLDLTDHQAAELVADGSADRLDAVLCLVQAAWGASRGWPWFGLPETMDPLEGWILSA